MDYEAGLIIVIVLVKGSDFFAAVRRYSDIITLHL